jgi:hypothetical protein
MKKLSIILIIGLFLFTSAFAQESSISFCGKVQVIDKKLEKKIKLFPEYSKFMQASLFQEGDYYILEIIHELSNQIKVERKKITQADLDVLCERINTKVTTSKIKDDGSEIDQSGRRELLITSTALGIGAYGWMLPVGADLEGRGFLATYMLVGAGSFFAPFGLTSNKRVTKGMARAYGWGSALGMAHGAIFHTLVTDIDAGSERTLISTMVGGLVEGGVMYHLAGRNDWDRGKVGAIGTGGLWGGGLGLSLGSMIAPTDANSENSAKNLTLSSSLLFSGLGMYGGALWAKKNGSVTNGDVIVTNATGLLGVRLGTALVTSFDLWDGTPTEFRSGLGILTATAAGGIAYGLYRTSDYDYSTAEGVYIGLGEVSGGLLGLGITYLVTNEITANQSAWSTTIGATAGFALVDYLVRRNDVKINPSIGNWTFDLNPTGFSSNFEYGEDINIDQLKNASHAVKASLTF